MRYHGLSGSVSEAYSVCSCVKCIGGPCDSGRSDTYPGVPQQLDSSFPEEDDGQGEARTCRHVPSLSLTHLKTDARVQLANEGKSSTLTIAHCVETRICSVLNVVRMIKLFGWESRVSAQLDERREAELKQLSQSRWLEIFNALFKYVPRPGSES